MIRRLSRTAAQIIPFLLIFLIIIGNAFARVFLSKTPQIVGYIALIAALSIAAALIAAHKPVVPPPVMRPLAVLWLAAAVSTLVARDKQFAAIETILWASIILIFWASTFLEARRVERIIFAVLAAYAALALLQVGWSLVQPGGFMKIPRAPAMTPNPNNIGAAMLPAVALAFWRRRWFWLGVFVLALVISGARASLGGLLISTVATGIWMLNHRTQIPRTVWLIGGTVALLILPIAVLQITSNTHGTLALRLDIWRAALLTFRDHPFTGIGPQNFEYGFLQYKQLEHIPPVHQHAHSIVLHIGAELGIIGLMALAYLACVLVKQVIRMYQNGDHERAVIIEALFAALAVQGMLEYVYWVAASVWIVMLTGWALSHAPDMPLHQTTRAERIGVAAVWSIGVLLILALPLTVWQPTLLGLELAFGFYLTTRW